jgi:hypothetical protein
MTKQEAMRLTHQQNVLMELGFTQDEADKLRRISMTLRTWHERECGIDGGCIERENDDGTGRAFWHSSHSGKRWPIRDMETGAKRRLAGIVDACNKARRTHMTGDAMTPQDGLRYYIQGDPRGAALYIIRPGDIPAGQTVDSCYSRGIAVY